MDEDRVVDRALSARALEQNETSPEQLRVNLVFAAGVLLGGDLSGCASAVEVAWRQLFPDHEFPRIG